MHFLTRNISSARIILLPNVRLIQPVEPQVVPVLWIKIIPCGMELLERVRIEVPAEILRSIGHMTDLSRSSERIRLIVTSVGSIYLRK